MYMGTPHAREVGKRKLFTEDQILIHNCLITHRYTGFNINWSAKIAKVHYTIPFVQKGTCQK